MKKIVLASVILLSLGACSLAPKFVRPDTQTPEAFREAEGVWKAGEPAAHAEKGAWWTVFNDEVLNKLEAEAETGNQSLQSMAARVKQARQTARIASSFFFPSVDGNASYTRHKPAAVERNRFGGTGGTAIEDTYSVGGSLSYEADLFGRVLDGSRAAKADAETQEALYQNTKLALQADVADAYFSVRALDADIALLQDTLRIREESLGILKKRLEIGVITELDIAESVVDLETTRTELQNAQQARKETESTLAVLLGIPPAHFKLTEAPFATPLPVIPAGLPSALLERRPDIAAAERALAAANARIGIARAAFFPVISLTATGGFSEATLADVFQWSSRSWTLGPLLTTPIFGGGRAIANYRRSKAEYEQIVADYRQQVLVAFKDVEDSLALLKTLSDQSTSQQIAEAAAERADEIAGKRYESGDVGYLEAITARRNALQAQRFAITVQQARLQASVRLIRALGGGWE